MEKSLATIQIDWLSLIEGELPDALLFVSLLTKIKQELGIDFVETRFDDKSGIIRSYDENGLKDESRFSSDFYVFLNDSSDFDIVKADLRYWYRVQLVSGVLVLGSFSLDPFSEGTEKFANAVRLFFRYRTDQIRLKKTEDEAYLNRTLLLKVIESIPDYVAYKDSESIYRLANRNAESMFDTSIGSIVGKSVDSVYTPEEAQVVRLMDCETLASPTPIHQNFEPLTKMGRIRLDTIRDRILDADGKPIGIVTISRDVEGVRKAEVELDRKARLQEILMKIASEFINTPEHQSTEAIDLALRMVGEFILADRAYLFTYDFREQLMHNTNEWCALGIPPAIDDLRNVPMLDFYDNWVNPHKIGKTVHVEDVTALNPENSLFQILNPQGVRSLVTVPLKFMDETLGFVGFDAVTTVRHWTKEDLLLLEVLAQLFTSFLIRKKRYDELINAKIIALSANQAKTSFLSNMSHEIRTPLVSVFNAIYLIASTNLSRDQKDYLDIINNSLDLLYTLVNGILDLSKIEAGKFEIELSPVNLEEVLLKIAKAQSYVAFDKGLKLIFDYDYSTPYLVMTDGVRLHQIIVNLINNAIKFTDSGEVTLKTTVLESNEDKVVIEFAIIDTGIGIPKDKLEYITEKYYQAATCDDGASQGTGLGLTISDELVNLLGGNLKIKSQVGEGTKVFFQLELKILERTNAACVKTLDGLRIILAGDSDVRRPIASLLTSLGVRLSLASGTMDGEFDFYGFVTINSDKLESCLLFLDQDNFKCAMINPELVSTMIPKFILPLPITKKKLCETLSNKISDEVSCLPATHISNQSDYRLLVVDDNPMNRRTLAAILNRVGYVTDVSRNGREALEMIQKKEYALMLLDIQMPEMNGFQLAERIRKILPSKPHVPILALSANALKSDLEQALNSGMDGFIAKPILPEQLLALIADYLPNNNGITTQQAVLIRIPDTIPSFEETSFSARFKNEDSLAIEMIEMFLNEYHHDIDKIEDAILSGNSQAIVDTTHYFKGSCLYVSASRLVWLCQIMMSEAQRLDIQYLKNVLMMIRIEVQTFQNMISIRYQKGGNSR